MSATGDARGQRIRLAGQRFVGGRLPVDSLTEIQNYQALLRQVAEIEWRAEHPGEDVPEDLAQSTSLVITEIADGSADVHLQLEYQALYAEHREIAQFKADSYVSAAYNGEELTDLVPDPDDNAAILASLEQIGVTLRGEQKIEFYSEEHPDDPVVITPETRAGAIVRIEDARFWKAPTITTVEAPKVAREQGMLVGRVTAIDADNHTFELWNPRFGKVTAHYKRDPDHLNSLRDLVNESGEGPLTRVTGQIQYKGTKLFRVWTVDAVELFEPTPSAWTDALIRIAELGSGWDEMGEAPAPSFAALDAADAVMRKIAELELPRPSLFPTHEGGVLLEWSSAKAVFSIEISADVDLESYALPEGAVRGELRVLSSVTDAAEFARVVAV